MPWNPLISKPENRNRNSKPEAWDSYVGVNLKKIHSPIPNLQIATPNPQLQTQDEYSVDHCFVDNGFDEIYERSRNPNPWGAHFRVCDCKCRVGG